MSSALSASLSTGKAIEGDAVRAGLVVDIHEAIPAPERDQAVYSTAQDLARTNIDPIFRAGPDDPGGPWGCWYATGDNGAKSSDGAYGHDVGGKSGEGPVTSA